MIVLAIETSGTVGSVALCEVPDPDGPSRSGVSWERSFTAGLIHGRELAPAVQAALEETGTALADVGLIAVSQGPGSYTGLRVGIAFAKALAWAAKRPLVGVGSLRAMAENAGNGISIAAPVLDARWGQVYGAVYRRENGKGKMDNGQWREVVPPEAAEPEAFAAKIPDGATLFGDALKRYGNSLMRPSLIEGDAAWAVPKASVIARLGAAAFRASGGRDEAMTLLPLYLRPTEAEVNAGLKSR